MRIKEYFDFRLSLGFAMRNTNYVFIEFDNFVFKKYSNFHFITREMITEYIKTKNHLSFSSKNYRLALIRGFCKYLYHKNTQNYIPEFRLIKSEKSKFKPYIFSHSEVQLILKKLKSPSKRKINTASYVATVGLLYTTGLRVGEVCRLNLEDVDFRNKMLFIRRSKFYKSRLVPVSGSVVEVLKKYKLKRLGCFRATNQKEPFFVGVTGNRLHENLIGRQFRKAVKELGITSVLQTNPRLHDLRHTFATRTLEEIYQKGKNPEIVLPILATYMGHVDLTHTQTYLHASQELLMVASDKFNKYSKSIRRKI